MDTGKKEVLNANTSHDFALVCMRFLTFTAQPLIACHLLQCRRANFILTKY